ncbi:MAG: hypothetical protein Fur0037_17350 [Planctomycetota bacterium]
MFRAARAGTDGLWVLGRGKDGPIQALIELHEDGGKGKAFHFDVAKPKAVEDLVMKAIAQCNKDGNVMTWVRGVSAGGKGCCCGGCKGEGNQCKKGREEEECGEEDEDDDDQAESRERDFGGERLFVAPQVVRARVRAEALKNAKSALDAGKKARMLRWVEPKGKDDPKAIQVRKLEKPSSCCEQAEGKPAPKAKKIINV